MSSKLNKAESRSWEMRSCRAQLQHYSTAILAAPHTRDTPALLAAQEDQIQLPSLQMTSPGSSCWALTGSQSHVQLVPMYSPDAALHHCGHCCSRSLRVVGSSMYCKGCQHCNQFQWLSFWFTFSTSSLRKLNCLFNPLALEQKIQLCNPG